MVTALGRRLGTVLGTELVDFTEEDALPAPTFDATKLYALSFSALDFLETAAGGGEVGDAGGFGALVLAYVSALAGAAQSLVSNQAAAQPYSGFYMRHSGANQLVASIATTTAAIPTTPGRVVTASDVGRLHLFGFVWDAAASRLRLYADRQEIGTATTAATYVVATLGERLGLTQNDLIPATTTWVLGRTTFRGVPTLANMQAAFDAARTLGDVPTSITGVTVTHRLSVKETLAALNVAAPDGSAAPASIPDTITAATVDAMTRTGSPTVRVIDPATTKWSYETTPLTYGGNAWTDTAYYQSTAGDLAGPATGKSVAMLVRVESQAVANRNRDVFGLGQIAASGARVAMRVTGTNSLVTTYWYNGSIHIAAPSITIAATDVGKQLLWISVWDVAAQRARTYSKRVEVSTGSVMTAFDPGPVGTVRLGNIAASGAANFNAENITILGCQVADVAWTLAEVQALYDSVVTAEDMVQVPGAGRSAHLWSVRRDLGASPSALPATLTDRVGSLNLALTGTPALQPIYSRAFAW